MPIAGLPYPALAPGKGVVHGELYELMDKGALAVMDAYEEYHPSQPKRSAYLRERWRLADPDLDCWVYVYNLPVRGLPRVLGGLQGEECHRATRPRLAPAGFE